MTTPGILAHLPTSARRRALDTIERSRLNRAVSAARGERAAAGEERRTLTDALHKKHVEEQKLRSRLPLYPQSTKDDQYLVELGVQVVESERELSYAVARHEAAKIVMQSAELELAWLDRPQPGSTGPDRRPGALVIPLWHHAETEAAVTSPGYTVTVFSSGGAGVPWRAGEPVGVRRSQARDILFAWARRGAHILRDCYGRLFVALPELLLELVPTDLAPPHTEGDVLRAALAAYGFPAYDDGEGGVTWLAVPLDPDSSEADTYRGLHFRIASGGRADRPASAHDEPWNVSLYDADGDHIATFDAALPGSPLAGDCAHTARTITAYAARAGG